MSEAQNVPTFNTKKPCVIMVLGQTASGKTRFAVNLAKLLNSVVVCADAFQVYRDFSVATDKITVEEMDGVLHYGLDLVPATSEFTVKDFLVYSVPVIEQELAKGRSVIVVGGTHMYLEKLLFTSCLDSDEVCVLNKCLPCEFTHAHLSTIDPEMALRLHPNDIRRISRAIEFYYSTGSQMSRHLSDQNRSVRFENVCVICKIGEENVENLIRLRIEQKMLANNALLNELIEIDAHVQRGEMHWKKGLLQAIGYREFESNSENTSTRTTLLPEQISQMISNTLKYSKKQRKWINKIEKCIKIHKIQTFNVNEIINILSDTSIQWVTPPKW